MPRPESLFSGPRVRTLGRAALTLLAAFGPAAFVHAPLLRGELPLFRDVRHFYQPMEARQQRAWSEGRVPLWNDAEGIGFPEFAEPTAATFYPGKVLFALPIDWGARWFVYFVAHAGVAFLGARRFAMACGLSASAGLLAGTAYAASGELLFQSCNPVYLVGAAWAPWILAESLSLRRTGRWGHAVGLAVVAALAVLGGDPQTVYHAALLIGGALAFGLVAAAFAKSLSWYGRFGLGCHGWLVQPCLSGNADFTAGLASRGTQRTPNRYGNLKHAAIRKFRIGAASRAPIEWPGLARLAGQATIAGALAIGLASIQIVPSIEWFGQSERAASTAAEVDEGPDLNRFDFSVGPWRWSEFVAPEVLGSPFPVPRRWSYAFFPERRIWTPSYYLGLLPILLLPAAAIVARTRRRALIPAALAIVGLTMACGRYGLGFLAKQFAAYAGVDLDVAVEWGSPYVLAVETLPLYDLFRYPAKWMPIASLGICVAGAAGLDALRPRRGRRSFVVATALMLIAAASASIVARLPVIEKSWNSLPIRGDVTFGPWDAAGSLADLRVALLHVAIVAACALAILATGRRRRSPGSAARVAVGLALLAVFDVAWANRDLVPAGRYEIEPAATISWSDPGMTLDGPTATRFLRGSIDGLPNAVWQKTSSPNRLHELARWERDSYRPRLGPDRPPALRSTASLEPSDLAPFLSAWRDSRLTARDPEADTTIRELEELSVGLLVLPVGVVPARGELVRTQAIGDWNVDVALWRLPNATPRWSFTTNSGLVRRAEAALTSGVELSLSPEERATLSVARSIEDSSDLTVDFRGLAVRQDRWTTPEQVQTDWSAEEPGLVFWNDRFDPGWRATCRGEAILDPYGPLEVGRTAPNGRFVVVPAGDQRLTFVYSPRSLRIGAFLSLASIVIAACMLAAPALRRRHRGEAV